MKILQYALAYAKKGISVIPVGQNKQPLVLWQEYQKTIADEATINYWWERWPEANVGIVCGKVSGLVVVDVDSQDVSVTNGLELPPTPTVKTARGWHYYYKHPGKPIPNAAGKREHIDIRADGGFVVAPPSVHATGAVYEWVLTDTPFSECPKWVMGEERIDKDWTKKMNGTTEGGRNQTAAELAGKLLRVHKESEWDFAWQQLVLWNGRNTPPMDEKELRATFDSIKGREISRRKKSSGGISQAEIEDNSGEYRIITTTELIEKLKNEKIPPLVSTGIKQLDDILGGGQGAGEIFCWAGWPGAGKTMISTYLTKLYEEGTALWFQYECSEREFIGRYAGNPPLFYVPSQYKHKDIFWMTMMIKKAVANFPKIRFVFVDALQSAMNFTHKVRPDIEIADVMHHLRELSNEINGSGRALNLHLLSRVTKPNPNADKREMEMGDVPGSADIEHEVDFSIYLQRVPNDYNPWKKSHLPNEFNWRDAGYNEDGTWYDGDNRVLLKMAKARPTRARVSKVLLKLENGVYDEAQVEFKKKPEKKHEPIIQDAVEDKPIKELWYGDN